MPENAKVIEAEVISRPAAAAPEKVKVSRLPAALLLRGVHQHQGNPDALAKYVRELSLRIWLWLVGFAAIAAACFYGAATVQTVIWSAFLIIAGLACACAMSVTWLLIWALRRVSPLA